MKNQFSICQVTEQNAQDFIGWRYAPPYDLYNLDAEDSDDSVAYFLAPSNGYLTVRNADGQLAGFCCFGFEGRVPGGDYALEALDVGIGMRPELTGQGLGHDFVAAVLAHAEDAFSPQRLRATIARFNRRSQRVFERHGFQQKSSFFRDASPPREYVILVKEVNHGRG